MSNDTVIKATANPAAANKLAAAAMAQQEATTAALQPDPIKLPPETTIELPAGLVDPFTGVSINTAEVRELTGVDEETISKISDLGKALLTILERATVKIGDEVANKDILDALFAGDREMILLGIRNVTFGPDIKIGPGNCPSCGVEQTFEVDLVNDVPIKKLEGSSDFTVSCKVGEVQVSLPTGVTQKALITSTNKTSAELDTILLKNCIKSINGAPVINPETVRNLGIKDRKDILEEITNRNPGPQLSEIKKPCQSCGTEVPLPLTLAELFR
jgi:hypothetical protein